MTKGFLNVLLCLLYSVALSAQVEVVPLPKKDEARFDNLNPKPLPYVQVRKIPDSLVRALQKDEAFWYANAQPVKKEKDLTKQKLSNAWLKQQWVRVMFWVVFIGAFAAVLIWYLSSLNIRLFRKPAAAISTLPGEEVTEDIFSIQYEKEIEHSVQDKNFRLAVRLYYLKTLSELANKNLIEYKRDRTNYEYIMQLNNTALYNDFSRLTRRFEYTWYGKLDLAAPAFKNVQKDFETFHRQFFS